MSELLDDVRTAAAKAGHTDGAAGDSLIGVGPRNDCREKRSLLTDGPPFQKRPKVFQSR